MGAIASVKRIAMVYAGHRPTDQGSCVFSQPGVKQGERQRAELYQILLHLGEGSVPRMYSLDSGARLLTCLFYFLLFILKLFLAGLVLLSFNRLAFPLLDYLFIPFGQMDDSDDTTTPPPILTIILNMITRGKTRHLGRCLMRLPQALPLGRSFAFECLFFGISVSATYTQHSKTSHKFSGFRT
jgi:hypothetical protein